MTGKSDKLSKKQSVSESETLFRGQKTTEAALRESQRLLQLVMDNIPQAVFWKDLNLVYLGCNQAFAEDAGLDSPDQIIGKTDFDMPWQEQAELYRADDQKVMDEGIAKLNYEEPQTGPTGEVTWLRTSKVPMVDDDGNAFAVLGMYEDITERKQVEEENERVRQRFEMILETTGIPTIISRLSDGIVLYANQALAQASQVNLDK